MTLCEDVNKKLAKIRGDLLYTGGYSERMLTHLHREKDKIKDFNLQQHVTGILSNAVDAASDRGYNVDSNDFWDHAHGSIGLNLSDSSNEKVHKKAREWFHKQGYRY